LLEDGSGEILNDDQATVILHEASVVEGDDGTPVLMVAIQLDSEVDGAVSVLFSTGGGSASAGVDYEEFSERVELQTGDNVVEILVLPDNEAEDDETISVMLSELQNEGLDVIFEGGGETVSNIATIIDDDAAPVLVDDGPYEVIEDRELVVSVESGLLANDSDEDDGREALRILRVVNLPEHGSVVLNEDGSFAFTPKADYFGPDAFSYEVTDGTNVVGKEVMLNIVESVDLAVTIDVLQKPLVAGGDPHATFMVTVVNNGPSNATNVGLSQTSVFPPDTSLISATPSAGSYSGGIWTFDLVEGGRATLTIVVQAGEDAASGPDAISFAMEMTGSDQEDPDGANDSASGSVAVVKASDAVLTSTPPELSNQSGLFVSTVTVRNTGDVTVPAFRVFVSGLSADVQVYNATGEDTLPGSAETAPYILSNVVLESGASTTLAVEFFQASLEGDFTPAYTLELLPFAEILPSAGAGGIAVERMEKLSDGQGFLIEIGATPGTTYTVEYSDNMIDWIRVVPSVVAPANRLQWIDNGPPKTASAPDDNTQRFYRFGIISPAPVTE